MAGPLVLAGAVFILVLGVAAVAIAMSGGRGARAAHLTPSSPAQLGPEPRREARADDPSPVLTQYLERAGSARRMQAHLLKAGLMLRPSEMLVLTIGLTATGYVVGLYTKGWLVGVGLGIVGALLPNAYVNMRIGRRRKALGNQLSEGLSMMASSLRSGYSFMRAMQVVAEEMDPPISEEFSRVLDELNLGVAQDRALQHLLERCPSPDIELVVTACQIQATVGGNLAQILDTTAGMIRERARLQGEISALTAEGRLSATILTGLPVMLAVVVSRMSPGYMDPLFNTAQGLMMLLGAIGATLMGLLVIRKMLSVEI